MLVIGKSGIGKSSTIHHIALYLRDIQGFAIVPCSSPSDIKHHYKKLIKQVFLIDDICGRQCLNQNDVEEWVKESTIIALILNQENVKILMSCRLQIYFETQFERLGLLTQFIFELSSEIYSFEIRKTIARQYLSDDVVKKIIPHLKNHDFSPLLCKLGKYMKDENDVLDLFRNPYEHYKSNIHALSKERDKYKYIVLFLFVCSNGYIDDTFLMQTKINLIFNHFGYSNALPISRLKEELNSLNRTYLFKTKQCTYKRIQNRQFEYLCCYFGETRQRELIRFANVAFVHEKMYLECSNIIRDDLCIKINDENEEEYLSRLCTDWSNGNIYDVFTNRQMESELFRSKFLSFLSKLDKKFKIDLIETRDINAADLMAFHIVCIKGYIDLLEFIIKNINSIADFGDALNEVINVSCLNGNLDVIKCLFVHGASAKRVLGKQYPILAASISGMKLFQNLISSLEHNPLTEEIWKKTDFFVNAKKALQMGMATWIETFTDIFSFKEIAYVSSLLLGWNDEHRIAHLLKEDNIFSKDISDALRKVMVRESDHQDFLTLDYLLDHGADINETDEGGKSTLSHNCYIGHEKMVRYFVQNGANVNKGDNDGITPLHAAVIGGFTSVVSFLLDNGAIVNVNDKNCRTALWWAVKLYHPKIASLLLDKYIDVNQEDENGLTPLLVAITSKTYQPRNIISMEMGYLVMNCNEYMVKLLIQNGAAVNKNKSLIIAVEQGNLNIIDLLIDEGADINLSLNGKKISLLSYGCLRNNALLVNLVLKKGVSFEQKYEALVFACSVGFIEIVNLLLSNDSDLMKNTQRVNCTTPLSAACEKGFEGIVHLLLRKGANLNAEGYNCYTALIAACNSHKNVINILLDNGVDVNKTCKNGVNAITYACEKSSKEIVDLLLKNGADANHECDGITVLMRACIFGRHDIIESLLLNGADINKRYLRNECVENLNMYGFNALSFSCLHGNEQVTRLLLSNGATINDFTQYEHNPLITACLSNNASIVALLIDKGANVNKATKSGKTPLINASEVDINTVEVLIDHSANINAFDQEGNTALINASSRGKTDIVSFLLEKGADIDQENMYGATALTFACESGQIEVVDCLCSMGANINKTDYAGRTPIFRASSKGHRDVISYLIKRGAKIDQHDCQGKSVLSYACFHGDCSTAEFLLDNGANVNETTIDGHTILFITCLSKVLSCKIFELLIDRGADINEGCPLYAACKLGYSIIVNRLIAMGAHINKRFRGNTPVMVACQYGRTDIVRVLLENSADVSIVNNNNETCLNIACRVGNINIIDLLLRDSNVNLKDGNAANALVFACREEKYEIVKQMVLNGVDINHANSEGWTVLLEACSKGHFTFIEHLISNFADVNKGDNSEWTPLMEACKSGYLDIVAFFINVGADVNKVDDSGRSCVAIACQFGHINILKILMDNGCNPGQLDFKGKDSLFAAVEGGHIGTVRFLIDIGADVNRNDLDGSTVLIEACIKGNIDIIKLLIWSGAELNKSDKNGRTALIAANRHGRDDIINFLKVNGATESNERFILNIFMKVIFTLLLLLLLFSRIYIGTLNI